MTDDTSDSDSLMQFVDEESANAMMGGEAPVWRVLIIDDEKDVHSATTFALRATEVMGRPLEFLQATSAREAKEVLQQHDDIAVVLLDVVMETPNAGLDLVPLIRNELNIRDTRIILRTGQPNQAPEIEVIRDYDINDYKLKSELTQSRLFASLTTAIRSYKQIKTIEQSKKSLAMIVKSSAELLTQKGIQDFAQGVILHLSSLLSISPEGLICARRPDANDRNGTRIIAAAGQFTGMIDRPLCELAQQDAQNCLGECLDEKKNIYGKFGIALYLGSEDRGDMACFVSSEAELTEVDEHLLELFCSNITICADNLELVTQLSEFAYYDVLTGLPNRNSVVDKINTLQKSGEASSAVLCLVDVDHFAEVNASLGQDYGDALLKSIAKRLQIRFENPCVVSRFAADTFAVLGNENNLDEKALLSVFDEPFDIDGQEQLLSVSAGIVHISDVEGDGDEAVKDATIVLKTAKNHHRGQVLVFRDNMVKDAQGRLGMLRHLRSAFESGQLYLEFQPKLRLSDMAVTGFESLVRWKDQDGNDVAPDAFIPLAEKSGLIVKMGAWIFKESMAALKYFHDSGWGGCHMSVNLSVTQLQHGDVIDTLKTAVENAGVNATQVNLEITETQAVQDFDTTLSVLNDIKGLGFSLSLDDFGTGYSSLNYLQKMPLDVLKLDKSLIDSYNSESGRNIVEMILQLAERLKLDVVAEGVEKSEQIDFLKSLNCSQAQGFYYARPMSKENLVDWLKNNGGASI